MIVEDGSGVAGANSYSTRADYIAYAASLGATIADASAADVELVKAAEYIDKHEARLKGTRANRNQSMAFPRFGLVIDNWYWNANELPRQLLMCQWAFAIDIHNGVDLYNRPANPNLVARRQRVEGAVDVQFAVKDGADQKATFTSTGDALLNRLLKANGLQLVRS